MSEVPLAVTRRPPASQRQRRRRRRRIAAGEAVAGEGGRAVGPSPSATSSPPRHRRRRGGAQVRPGDRRRRPRRSRRRQHVHSHNLADRRATARRQRRGLGAARSRRGPSRASGAPTAGWDAQLCGRAHRGELFGHRGPPHRRGRRAVAGCWTTTRTSTGSCRSPTPAAAAWPARARASTSCAARSGARRPIRISAPCCWSGLGCEVVQTGRLKADYGLAGGESFQAFTIQESGGTRRAVEEGLARLEEMLPAADAARRTTHPGQRARARPAVRRLRRLVGRHLQPGAGRRRRPAGGARAAR